MFFKNSATFGELPPPNKLIFKDGPSFFSVRIRSLIPMPTLIISVDGPWIRKHRSELGRHFLVLVLFGKLSSWTENLGKDQRELLFFSLTWPGKTSNCSCPNLGIIVSGRLLAFLHFLACVGYRCIKCCCPFFWLHQYHATKYVPPDEVWKYMLKLNEAHLQHPYHGTVISFSWPSQIPWSFCWAVHRHDWAVKLM